MMAPLIHNPTIHLDVAEPIAAMGDAELLCLLLDPWRRAGHLTISPATLEQLGGLRAVARSSPRVLRSELGVTAAEALQIAAGVELGLRIRRRAAQMQHVLATPQAVARFMTARIGMLEHEELWVIALDGNNRARGVRRVAQGGQHGLSVSANMILRIAISEGASGMVLAHNHPSGNPAPSACDIEMTKRVQAATEVVGLALLDHVIVTANGDYCSLLERGLIDEPQASTSAPADRPSLSLPSA